jgi:hypothetical protein
MAKRGAHAQRGEHDGDPVPDSPGHGETIHIRHHVRSRIDALLRGVQIVGFGPADRENFLNPLAEKQWKRRWPQPFRHHAKTEACMVAHQLKVLPLPGEKNGYENYPFSAPASFFWLSEQ